MPDYSEKDTQARRAILIEGGPNLVVLLVKLWTGQTKDSLAVVGYVIHS